VRRRAFLARVPAIPALLPAATGTAQPAPAVRVQAGVAPAPRVQLAIDDLLSSMRRVSDPASVTSLSLSRAPEFRPEEWEARIRSGEMEVLAAGDRGFVYGLAGLRHAIESAGRIPESFEARRNPRFKVRRWSTAVSRDFGSPWDERINMAERFSYIKSDVIRRAADYGMNAIEINGRPDDGWDVDWVISFEKYPELAAQFPPGERKQRLTLLEDLASDAHRGLLDVLVWSHELHLPAGFVEIYPQVAGTSYPVCLSNDFLRSFIGNKYTELFTACPSVDGVVMSVNESGQFSLITDAGCRCDRCIRLSQHGRLMAVLNPVIEAARSFNKQVVLRTFQSAWRHDLYGHPELETIRKAYTGLPSHVQIMSKYCPLDFYGGAIADEPLIGAFPNPHLVEFSLDVEWQGRTFVPVLTPGNFQRRVAHAAEKDCLGVVARVDFPFPSMEPGPIFGHPNEFNAWFMGELLWDPKVDIDDSLHRWALSRYGSKSADRLAPALRMTEAITQKTFFCLGQTLISYHNMIAGVSFADNFLWSNALSKWDASKRKLSESFFHPDADLIRAALAEKAEAGRLAAEALENVRMAREGLSAPEYERLHCWFEKLRDSAGLYSALTELYLCHRALASSPSKPELVQRALSDPDQMKDLMDAAQRSLRKAADMERVHGANSWPVSSPDRGVSAYEFVQEVLRSYVSGLTGEPARSTIRWNLGETVVTEPAVDAGSVESVWRRLVESGRPGMQVGQTVVTPVQWPAKLAHIRCAATSMTLQATDGRSLVLPLTWPVRDITLQKAERLSIRKHLRELAVVEQPNE
jgi:hypothetical protein